MAANFEIAEHRQTMAEAVTPVQVPAFHSPAQLMMQAAASGMSVETIEKMMALQERFEANEARRAYVADFALFALERPKVSKNKKVEFKNNKGGTTSYSQETLDALVDLVGPVLGKHGFAHSWNTVQEGTKITVTCTLRHRLGHSESVSMEAFPDNSGTKNAIQAVASTITYLQRYTFRSVTGVAVHDEFDDDGAAANQAQDDNNPPLWNEAYGAAEGGWQSLADWMAARTEDERMPLRPFQNQLKQVAKDADAKRSPLPNTQN